MFEHIRAVRRFGRASRLAEAEQYAGAKKLCAEGLELLSRARPGIFGQWRVTKLVTLELLANAHLALGERDDARKALEAWLAFLEESQRADRGFTGNAPLAKSEAWVRSALAGLD